MSSAPDRHVFRPRARLLLLLGDQLIRDAGIAVFELVKNAYDADATQVSVALENPTHRESGRVVVQDDGSGMSVKIVEGVWLEPGTDYRAAQKGSDTPRTPRFQRLPLGEKGVGRFASSKLGTEVELVTRAAGKREVVVNVDWSALSRHTYLSEAEVEVLERKPIVFKGDSTGTRLTVTGLREPWTRGRVRQLHRAMTSITSPFKAPDAFEPSLRLEPNPGWLDDLPTAAQVMEQALYRADGTMSGTHLTYKYRFEPPKSELHVKPRRNSDRVELLRPPPEKGDDNVIVDLDEAGVGDADFHFRIYDLDPRSLQSMTLPAKTVRDYLKMNGGIRVYRDGVRVFDYGEPGDDWLDLGARRVNVPGSRLSNNQVVGAIHLSLADSPGLIEKTNREGFVENDAFRALADAALTAVEAVTIERNKDKAALRAATGVLHEPVTAALQSLRTQLSDRDLQELTPEVDRIEREYKESQERLLTAAGTGLQLMLVIHEVEKGVKELVKAVDREVPVERLRSLTNHLAELIEGLEYLTRKSGRTRQTSDELIRPALLNTEFRLRAHKIDLVRGGGEPFSVRCTRRLVVATLMNLIDNSIFWSDVAGASRLKGRAKPKRIYVGTTASLGGKAIVVADNGPGFRDDPSMLTQALVSRRPDGTGIGLYLADQVMKAHGGTLLFPDRGDAEVPPEFSGAVVALLFEPGKA